MPSLTIIKRFPYRGDANEEFSNTYYISGGVPTTDPDWRAMFDLWVTAEKAVYPATVSVVGGYGYVGTTEQGDAVWSVDLTLAPNTPVAGTLSTSGARTTPGDAAVWVRWGTTRFAKGKRIYLRKYFHGALSDLASTPDTILPGQKTALEAFGLAALNRTIGGRGIQNQYMEQPINHAACSYVTTRTLKRRGKRPPT